ncbi:hypothetical protein NP233_g6303 [Leucocoprinus birnbaumii]|uniref:C2H2-type domain-containing protein n=1 Tax=Leucocoprinus birnbaumii TaxID=56174 RepID=A0AAD5VSF9_9AGAR|nr:hypothetical protein NP233_g6303 [Leucocoprinus birnbaumii]
MPYRCLDCDRTFNSSQGVQSHSRAKGHAFPECDECDRIFVDENALNNHNNAAHKFCADCNRSFETYTGYRQHIANSSAHQDSSDTESDSYEQLDCGSDVMMLLARLTAIAAAADLSVTTPSTAISLTIRLTTGVLSALASSRVNMLLLSITLP